MPRASRLAAVLLAVSMGAGCHAHGDQPVSVADRGVTTTFHRSMSQPSIVELNIKNGTSQPVCLDASSFQLTSFSIKTDQGVVQSAAPAAAAASACEALAPGGEKSASIELGQGFSRLQTQVGKVCYRYGFGPDPAGAAPWHATGTLCE